MNLRGWRLGSPNASVFGGLELAVNNIQDSHMSAQNAIVMQMYIYNDMRGLILCVSIGVQSAIVMQMYICTLHEGFHFLRVDLYHSYLFR